MDSIRSLKAISVAMSGQTITSVLGRERPLIEGGPIIPGLTDGIIQTFDFAITLSNGLTYGVGENANWDPGILFDSSQREGFEPLPEEYPVNVVIGQKVVSLALGKRNRLYLVTDANYLVWKQRPIDIDLLEVASNSSYDEAITLLTNVSEI